MRASIDHLLYGTSDLDLGIDEIERLVGVRPAFGGQHLGLGTRNALLSLGGRTYLEVIAPDPSQQEVASPLPYGIASMDAPALRAWAASTDDIDAAVKEGRAAGIAFGTVTAHSRKAPGGEDVRWRMATRSSDEEGDVAVLPFLIDWGTTVHPSERAPGGVKLVSFRVFAPDPDEVGRKLRAIGLDVAVSEGDLPGLEAVVVGPSGEEVVLRS